MYYIMQYRLRWLCYTNSVQHLLSGVCRCSYFPKKIWEDSLEGFLNFKTFSFIFIVRNRKSILRLFDIVLNLKVKVMVLLYLMNYFIYNVSCYISLASLYKKNDQGSEVKSEVAFYLPNFNSHYFYKSCT